MSDKLKYQSAAVKDDELSKLDKARLQFVVEALLEGKPLRHIAVVASMNVDEVKKLSAIYCCRHKERDEKIVEAAKSGQRYYDIAMDFNLSVGQVSIICRNRGFHLQYKNLYKEEVNELIRQRLPDEKIGKQFGLSHTAIRNRRLKLNIIR